MICEDVHAAWETVALLAEDEALLDRGKEAARRLANLRQRLPVAAASLAKVKDYFKLS